MTGAINRLERLDRLRGLLSRGDASTAGELADELDISLRTLMRDLDVLRDSGLLIEADRGRGGGVRLARGHGGGRVMLSAAEAVDILISLSVAEGVSTPLLSVKGRKLKQKIAAVFPPAQREAIAALRRRILIGEPASDKVRAGYRPGKLASEPDVREAFIELRTLELRYVDERGRRTEREIEPHYLYLNAPAWYVLAWDRLRNGVRFFRFDRIASAVATSGRFRLAPYAVFAEAAEAGAEPL